MQNKKKILYIITIPDWGGAQSHVFNLAQKNKKANFDVIVASGNSSRGSNLNLIKKCADCETKTHKLKNLIRAINPIKDISALFEIASLYSREKPDFVHLHSSKAGIIGALALFFSFHNPKVVYTVHGWVFLEPMASWRKKLYIFLERFASQYRDKIIVLGEREKETALKHKICKKNKIAIIPHTAQDINFLEKNEAREALGLPQDKKIIGTIANLYHDKGLEYLIDVAKQIDNPDILFAIIGEGPLRENFEFQILNFELKDKILLLGEKEDAAQYLKAFDLFVLPSVKEGAPFVILEAMSADLPIIATDVGSVPEMLISYQNKTIVPPADVEQLKQAILKYI
ncbi:glycosyltransferase family 4 protein [Patescibacteria group bacterium]